MRKDIVVQTYAEKQKNAGLRDVVAQPLQVWAPVNVQVKKPKELDVFIVEESETLDILQLTGIDLDVRRNIFVWDWALSDLDGCLHLFNPSVLTPKLLLWSPSTPTLCLLDALDEAGFVGRYVGCTHELDSALVFDLRKPLRSKCYHHCVLARAEILKRHGHFHSGGEKSYYLALLGCKKPVALGLRAADYVHMLADHKENERDVRFADLEGPPTAPKRRPKQIAWFASVMAPIGAETSDDEEWGFAGLAIQNEPAPSAPRFPAMRLLSRVRLCREQEVARRGAVVKMKRSPWHRTLPCDIAPGLVPHFCLLDHCNRCIHQKWPQHCKTFSCYLS